MANRRLGVSWPSTAQISTFIKHVFCLFGYLSELDYMTSYNKLFNNESNDRVFLLLCRVSPRWEDEWVEGSVLAWDWCLAFSTGGHRGWAWGLMEDAHWCSLCPSARWILCNLLWGHKATYCRYPTEAERVKVGLCWDCRRINQLFPQKKDRLKVQTVNLIYLS